MGWIWMTESTFLKCHTEPIIYYDLCSLAGEYTKTQTNDTVLFPMWFARECNQNQKKNTIDQMVVDENLFMLIAFMLHLSHWLCGRLNRVQWCHWWLMLPFSPTFLLLLLCFCCCSLLSPTTKPCHFQYYSNRGDFNADTDFTGA